MHRTSGDGSSGARPSRRRGAEVAYLAACFVVAVALTWPLVGVFTTRICGDWGDPFQTLWGMQWMRDALTSLRNPFFTDAVFYPKGATLVFQTFDLPSAVAMVPLWGWLPEVAIYNTAVLIAVTVTAYGMFRLVREETGDAAAGFAAGILFAAVPYMFAHLQGHLHLLAMGWLPLALVHVVRVTHGRATLRDGVLGGLFLGLATLASWYHLLYALVILPVLIVAALVRRPRALLAGRSLRTGLVLAVTWVVLIAPLGAALVVERGRGPITGSHEPLEFSADLHAFAIPNAAQRAGKLFGERFKHWTGNSSETAAYVGYTTLALAGLGAWHHAAARPYVVAALFGAILAIGPHLQVDGRIGTAAMPYAQLERVVPLLAIAGVPVRFTYVMYLGLAVAAGCGLARLRARAARFGRGAAALAVIVPLVLVLVEYFPRPLITTMYDVPAPMRAWRDDPTRFAVLDVSDYYRPMWNATVHRKPMVWAYLTRVPERVTAELERHPVLRAILYGDQEAWFQRVDPTIDFAWGAESPGAPILPARFQVLWSGALMVPTEGSYDFWLAADESATVLIGGRPVLRRAGPCPPGGECEAHATLPLTAGPQAITIDYRHGTGPAGVHFWWRPPNGRREIVPATALGLGNGRVGLTAEYLQQVDVRSGLGREGGRAALRALGVRYVVVSEVGNGCVERDLELPLTYAGEGVRIYEVPPAS